MLFLCYPKCTTCKKAQRFLEEHGAAYTLRDIKTQNPTRDELAAWQAKSGLPLRRFFNTSGMQYRALNLKETLDQMSEAEQLDMLASDGMLVKRPILALEDRVLVGFRETEWAQALEAPAQNG